MPKLTKVAEQTITKAEDTVKRGRGRPKGSKNTDAEVLYTYRADDGCTMKSAVKPKYCYMTCKHHKEMKHVSTSK